MAAPPRDEIANGINSAISPLMEEFQNQYTRAILTQELLIERVERLTAEMNTECFDDLQLEEYSRKLIDCQRRLARLKEPIKRFQERIDAVELSLRPMIDRIEGR